MASRNSKIKEMRSDRQLKGTGILEVMKMFLN